MEGINLELRLFLSSIVWGITLIVFYDCFRIFRRIIKHNKFWAAFEDVIYWTVSAFLIFCLMYQMNDGAIRGFALVGILIGMVLYHYSISSFIVKFTSLGIEKCILSTKKFIKFISKPIRWILRRFRWFFEFFKKIFRRPLRLARKALKKVWKTVKIAVVKK